MLIVKCFTRAICGLIIRNEEKLFYKCGWSPFESYTFKSRIVETLVNGERVYSKGKILSNKVGRKLDFTRG